MWTTTALTENLLRLDIVDSDAGHCYVPAGDHQLLRRVVPERRLPSDRPISDPRR